MGSAAMPKPLMGIGGQFRFRVHGALSDHPFSNHPINIGTFNPPLSLPQQQDGMSGSSTPSSSALEAGHSKSPRSFISRANIYLSREVDSKRCSGVSVFACFLTGYTACLSFTACYIWCGFQTGNVAQLGLGLARTFNPEPYRTYGFQKPDQQALVSLLSFIVGTSFGRFFDKIGFKRRKALVAAAFLQCLFAMAAALCSHYSGESGIATNRGEPNWVNAKGMAALGFLSATLGLQGIIGKRIGSPMNTTVVLTTTWVELFNDPFLFSLKPVASRDIRAAGVFALFLGAFVARAIVATRAGQAGTQGVLVGLRLVQLGWWAMIQSPPPKEGEKPKDGLVGGTIQTSRPYHEPTRV